MATIQINMVHLYTCMHIIIGFQKFGDILPQEFASQYIPNPFSSDESALSVLCKILKDTYKSHNFFNKAGGPGIGRMKFVNLAVVKKKNITEDEKERDRFLKRDAPWADR